MTDIRDGVQQYLEHYASFSPADAVALRGLITELETRVETLVEAIDENRGQREYERIIAAWGS